MSKIQDTIQCSTIANLLATELKRRGISLPEDEDARYNIIYASAESILYEGTVSDIHDCIASIDEYIIETLTNYPNYFMTGEET